MDRILRWRPGLVGGHGLARVASDYSLQSVRSTWRSNICRQGLGYDSSLVPRKLLFEVTGAVSKPVVWTGTLAARESPWGFDRVVWPIMERKATPPAIIPYLSRMPTPLGHPPPPPPPRLEDGKLSLDIICRRLVNCRAGLSNIGTP